jgi:starch synthase
LKYGTVPIVRATGGLADTIQDLDPVSGEGNGFKFKDYSSSELLRTVKLALETYRDKATWERLMLRGMAMDFSWEQSARAYVQVYEDILTKKRLSAISR